MAGPAAGTAGSPRTLADWLDYQQSLHPRGIELGLERVREVWQRLGAARPAPVVITVAGTNGKGSTVAFLEAMLGEEGLRTGCYTSPHLLRYNERVRIDAVDTDDAELIEAFERIEAARGGIALTWFEFGTLAALLVFAQAGLDVAVLEVGLGGRLDAVNIVDADAAIVTTIGLDHEEWLGAGIERIAVEKAGIFRAGRVAVIGDASAAATLQSAAASIGARAIVAGVDYRVSASTRGWRWSRGDECLELPPPRLRAPCQVANAAAAIAALDALRDRLPWQPEAIARAVASACVAARLQRFRDRAELVIDVAHNPQAARVLAEALADDPVDGQNIAVFAALADKDIAGIVAALRADFPRWYLAGLDAETPRGLDAATLRGRVGDLLQEHEVSLHADVAEALAAARRDGLHADRIVAFGSFFVAAVALAVARDDGLEEM